MTDQLIGKFPPIDGGDSSSFAAFTIKNRFPVIIDRVIEDNEYPASIVNKLQALKCDVQNKTISRSLKTGTDKEKWNEWLGPHLGNSWFEAPFYFAEAYFYRLILDIIDYHASGLDPFTLQKQRDVSVNISVFKSILMDFSSFFDENPWKHQILKKLLYKSLWGNKSDLSQFIVDRGKNAATNATLIDDVEKIAPLFEVQLNRIDIILDNSGVELFTDLLISEKLVSLGLVNKVILHAKAYPTFVSDATLEDIDYLLNVLCDGISPLATKLYNSINSLKRAGNIVFNSHEFWNSPLHFFNMPHELKIELGKSDLVLFKGDANYRRVFGDRVLPHELEATNLANYLPSRSLAIRILKSEILVGMNNKQQEKIRQKDNEYLVNGKYGIIQLLSKG